MLLDLKFQLKVHLIESLLSQLQGFENLEKLIFEELLKIILNNKLFICSLVFTSKQIPRKAI